MPANYFLENLFRVEGVASVFCYRARAKCRVGYFEERPSLRLKWCGIVRLYGKAKTTAARVTWPFCSRSGGGDIHFRAVCALFFKYRKSMRDFLPRAV